MPFVATMNGISSIRSSEMRRLSQLVAAEIPLDRIQELIQLTNPPVNGTQAFAEKYRHFRQKTPWFHTIWYNAYDDPDLTNVYIQGPREHAKTSTVLTYALRRLCENHHLRVGIVSGADDLAMKFLGELKWELEANVELLRDYGPLVAGERVPFQGDQWAKHELVLSDAREGPDGISGKDVSVFAVGRGGQISSRHCDLLIIDDVESAKSVKSDLVRQSTREWWAREVGAILSPGGKFIVVGTRKHYDDIYSHLIGGGLNPENAVWHVVDVAKSVFLDTGSPIWPEMWDADALLKRKSELDAADVLAWSQEYLNEPRSSETQMFFPEKWPTYDRAPWGLNIYQYWDLAISEKQGADFTVGWTIGVDTANNVYLLERRRGHWDFNRTLAEITDMGHAWSGPGASGTLVAIGIEEVAYQAAAVQEAMRRTMLPIRPDKPDKDKVVRARYLEARAKPGKVYRPAKTPEWWFEFALEATHFPMGAHDDQIDSLTGAVRIAGWQTDSIAFAYGVWTCKKCAHMFSWSAGRPCPRCGTPADQEFKNPELEAYGEMGRELDHKQAPHIEVPLDAEERALVDLISAGETLAAPTSNAWPEVRASLQNVAAWFIDTSQPVRAQAALTEVARLDVYFRFDPEGKALTNGHV